MRARMAGNRETVVEVVEDACDALFGYSAENANMESMSDEDWLTLVVQACETLGIDDSEADDATTRTPEGLVDFLHARWDGNTRSS